MKLLAIDTSTTVCSICIWDGGTVLAEYVSNSPRTHTERLLPAIQMLLLHTGLEVQNLEGLAVVHGPGSFTGLRISLSVVKGLAFAWRLPVVTENALKVAAQQVRTGRWICPVMDARRKEVFTGLFERKDDHLIQVTEPVSVTPERWVEMLPKEAVTFCGPGAALYWEKLRNHEDSSLAFRDFVLARTLAELAEHRLRSGDFVDAAGVKAAYLRPSDAESRGPRRV